MATSNIKDLINRLAAKSTATFNYLKGKITEVETKTNANTTKFSEYTPTTTQNAKDSAQDDAIAGKLNATKGAQTEQTLIGYGLAGESIEVPVSDLAKNDLSTTLLSDLTKLIADASKANMTLQTDASGKLVFAPASGGGGGITATQNADLLIKNDTTSTENANIGNSYKGRQFYGYNASGDQYYGYEAIGDQYYGYEAIGQQSYGQGTSGDQYYGHQASGDIQIGSSRYVAGDGKGVLIHGSKRATFEEIINKVNASGYSPTPPIPATTPMVITFDDGTTLTLKGIN